MYVIQVKLQKLKSYADILHICVDRRTDVFGNEAKRHHCITIHALEKWKLS